MALINCPECGQQVSDKASTCIHCGAPLNEKNGEIWIKCSATPDPRYRVTVTNAATNQEMFKLREGEVKRLTITKDTEIIISFPLMKSIRGVLQHAGTHNYEITASSGVFWAKLLFNEVTNIDSGN